jgi:fibronectin type 3 domain-containing protein
MIWKRYYTKILSALIISIFMFSAFPSLAQETSHANIKINDDATNENQWFTDIDIGKENMAHVVWNDRRDDTLSVYYANSDIGGLSFSTNIKIADVEVDDLTEVLKSGPVVAADEAGNVFIAYYTLKNGNYDILTAVSNDNGASFTAGAVLPDGDGKTQVAVDMITAGANTIYLTWMDYTVDNSQVMFTKSSDGGTTFGSAVKVSKGTDAAAFPRMALDSNGYIHLVWQDSRDGGFNIYYSVSKDGGVTFSSNKLIAGVDSADQTEPAIAVDNGNHVYVTYTNVNNTESDIHFIKSLDSGDTWLNYLQISDDIENTTQKTSRMAVDSTGKIYVVWEDNRSHRGDIYYDIYTSNSTDSGLTFGTNEKVNNDPYKNIHHLVTNHIWADIVIDSTDKGYVTWVDNREKNYDVYLANLPLGAHKDTIPPTIVHAPVSSGTVLRPIEIEAVVTDNVAVSKVTFYYRIIGDLSYISFAMTNDEDVYTAEIPGTHVTTAGLEYYLEATDGVSTASYPPESPSTMPLEIGVTTLQPPAMFSAEAGDESVTFTWSNVDGAAGYFLYKSELNDSGFEKVSLVKISGTTFEDTQVEPGKTYYYYVKSVDTEGIESVASATKEATLEKASDDDENNYFYMVLVILLIIAAICFIIYTIRLLKIKKNK